jgi:hypothetical protein
MGMYLINVHLTGVHLESVHLTGNILHPPLPIHSTERSFTPVILTSPMSGSLELADPCLSSAKHIASLATHLQVPSSSPVLTFLL